MIEIGCVKDEEMRLEGVMAYFFVVWVFYPQKIVSLVLGLEGEMKAELISWKLGALAKEKKTGHWSRHVQIKNQQLFSILLRTFITSSHIQTQREIIAKLRAILRAEFRTKLFLRRLVHVDWGREYMTAHPPHESASTRRHTQKSQLMVLPCIWEFGNQKGSLENLDASVIWIGWDEMSEFW